MDLEVGTEKRFLEYVGNLSDGDKIALISHSGDLDGVVSAIVVNKVIDVDILKFVNYMALNDELVEELKKKKVNKVIFTDLFIKSEDFIKRLEKFADVLIIDHHPVKEDWNSDKTVFIKVEAGYCAGYLCYKLFGKIENLEKIDWLVACSCISDYCFEKPSAWIEGIFEKYKDKFEIINGYVRKNGKFWDLISQLSSAIIYFQYDVGRVYDSIKYGFGEIGSLKHYADEVENEINDAVKRFEVEREEFIGGYLFILSPKFKIGSIVSNIVSGGESNKIYLIVNLGIVKGRCLVGARRQDGKQDMGTFLEELLKGFENYTCGGHVAAAGGNFPEKYFGEFMRRLGLKEKA